MADAHDDDICEEDTPGYVAPKEKAVTDIINQDQDDEALVRYKQQLLGNAASGGPAIVFPDVPSRVIVQTLSIIVPGREDMTIDLTTRRRADAKKSKPAITLKEGCQYKVKISFYVQREIVTGLKYVQHTYRKGIKVDKDTHMVGSYGPKMEMQQFITKSFDEAPSGMIARGDYTIKSKFTDDDKHIYSEWDWTLSIKKDWE